MEKKLFSQTKFDSLVTNKTMQIIKAVIPYIDHEAGKYIGMFIKLQEFQNALLLNCCGTLSAMDRKPDDHTNDINLMFEDIKDFLGDEERETFETLMSMMEMMNTMNADEDAKQNFMGNYMDMFGL